MNIEKFLQDNGFNFLPAWKIDKNIFDMFNAEKIKEVIKYNMSFVSEHGLNADDIKAYIDLQQKFENRTNNTKKVNPGDILEVWSNNEKIFFQNAHIEKCRYNDTGWTYVEHASSFCNSLDSFSTSGGAWNELDIKKIKHIGTRLKTVWTWGHTGAKGNGGLYVPVKVNVFKLVLDKKFIPFVVIALNKKDEYGYKYIVKKWDKKDCCFHCYNDCFKTLSGLKNYLKNRHLKIGKKSVGFNGCYREIIGDFDYEQHMDKKSYNVEKGDLKEFPLLSNGEYTAAFYKDGKVHFCNPNVHDRTKLACKHD